MIDLANHSWNGGTRVVGIYVDPLIASGIVQKGSPSDSEARLQNDLKIDNIAAVPDAGNYNQDELQEIYFSSADKTAALYAIIHIDENVEYANYKDKSN